MVRRIAVESGIEFVQDFMNDSFELSMDMAVDVRTGTRRLVGARRE
jgi:hypothetical protein